MYGAYLIRFSFLGQFCQSIDFSRALEQTSFALSVIRQ